jgi:Cytochrome C'
MRSGWQTSVPPWSALLVLLIALGWGPWAGNAANQLPPYEPVSPPVALTSPMKSNLLAVRDWLRDKDFASATETIRGLTLLADLASYQSLDENWQKRCIEMKKGIAKLADASGRKSLADAEKALAECNQLLDDLVKNAPTGEGRKPFAVFKPGGSVKTWMLVMEWSHLDGTSAKTGKELEQTAQAIAEEANALVWLRNDAIWRSDCANVREAALKVATQAKGDDLAAAKKGLKTMYQQCEACHNRTRKK